MQLFKLYIYFFLFLISYNSFSQSYNDGPIEITVKLREIGNYYQGDDWSVFGTNVNTEAEDFTYKLWFSDNLNLQPWIGYGPLGNPIEGPDNLVNTPDDEPYTADIVQVSNSGTNSPDFNSIVSVLDYNTTLVPEFLKMKFFSWEDDNPTDPFTLLSVVGITINTNGFRNVFEPAYCQYTLPWWLGGGCAPLANQGDDYACEAEPFYTGLNWRYTPNQNQIPPCSFYSHGQITGSGCVNNSGNSPAPNTDTYYRPHIETSWRYTKGNLFSNSIELGALTTGNTLQHFNSNECYTDYYNNSSGNDVIYSFTINNPTGVNISLCGLNGAQFDSYLYLIDANDTSSFIASNDNSCGGLQSSIIESLCMPGTYYIVVDATSPLELGTFTIEISEDPTNAFSVVDSVSNYNGENISCHGGSDGKIYANISGGTPPYNFTWSNGYINNTSNPKDSITNLLAGTYTVTVTDFKGCVLPLLSIALIDPTPITVSTISTDASCNSYNDGYVTVSSTFGGVPNYSYSWNTIPQQTGLSATGLSAGLYQLTVTDNNGCQIIDQSTVGEPPSPLMNIISSADPPLQNNPITYEVCDGDDITITASGSNITSYLWSPNIWLNTNIGSTVISSPNGTMQYTCTGIDNNGCSTDVVVEVNTVSSVVMYVDPPLAEVCEGEDIEITFFGSPGTNFNWFPPTYLSSSNNLTGQSITVTPQDTITYTITAQNSSGCIDQMDYFIDIKPAPNINLTSPSLSVCQGDMVPLSASGATSYSWSPSFSLNTNIGSTVNATPSINTIYQAVGIGSNGCKDSSQITINSLPLPVLNVSGSNEICEGESTSLTVSGANTYIWSPSTSLNTTIGNTVLANPAASQTYYIYGTDLNNCDASISFNLSVLPSPNITVSASKDTICFEDISILTASGGATYSWSPASSLNVSTGNFVSASPSNSTTYSVVGTSANNCQSTSSITIEVNSLPNLSVSPNISTICEDSTIIITAQGASNYIWSPALGLNTSIGNTVSANPSSTSYYTVTGTDLNGCTNTTSTTVNVNSKPVINLSTTPNTNNICEGASIVIDAFGAISYSWQPSAGLNQITGQSVIASPSTSTNYIVLGTDQNNCKNTAEIMINVGINPTISVSPSNPIICQGESVTLFAEGANQYNWTPSSSLTSSIGSVVIASPLVNTSYTVTGIDSLGCEGVSIKTVNVNPLPTVNFLQDTLIICNGEDASILLDVSGSTNWDILYSINGALQSELYNIDSNPVLINSSEKGSYTIVSITDENNCVNIGEDTLYVDVLNMPIADFLTYGPDGLAEFDILQPEISFLNTSFSAINYSWYFGDPPYNGTSNNENPTYTFNEPGSYPVTLIVENGPCIDDTIKNILIKPVFTLFLPDAFTPDGDGLNDFFPWDCGKPLGTSIEDFSIFVYNSWGEEVFSSNDVNACWNGKMEQDGQILQGYYTYIIQIVDILGVHHTKTGKVLLN